MRIPIWLSLFAQSHFELVCLVVCFGDTFLMVLIEKTLINSGQFGRNTLALLCPIVIGAGQLLNLEIYRSAHDLGLGQPAPKDIVETISTYAAITGVITFVLALKDKSD